MMTPKTTHLTSGDKQLEFGFAGHPVPAAAHPAEPAPCMAAAPAAEPPKRELQRAANALHKDLGVRTGLEIRLRITNNSSTMMSVRYDAKGKLAIVGLHHMFLDAPVEIRKALAAWVLKPSAKLPGRKLQAFIEQQRHLISQSPPRPVVPRTDGRHFDLKALYNELNREWFAGEVKAPITWGKMPSLRRRRSIRFGSYSPGEDLIRIHPLLDQTFVPLFFVRYIVFHEMLHAHMGIEEGPDGRRRIHPPAFREREACYEDYDRALAWMEDEKNLRRLLLATRK